MRRPFRSLSLCCLTLLTAGLLTACGGESSTSSAEDAAAGYPRTVENCGREITVDSPPERVVSLTQGTTEILLSLGLADRMVGTATWTDPVLEHLEEANSRVPRLADHIPSYERVLAEQPDFVTSSFESVMQRVSSREKFARLGVPTYISPSDCAKNNEGDGDGVRDEPLTMDLVYEEIRQLAEIFDVEQRGQRLVEELRGRIAEATEGVDASGVSLLYWFANKESPYMAGCCGAPGVITDRVGARNVFDDTHKEWPQINWETVAARDPDVLVLGDLIREQQTAEEAAQKIDFLESNPVTKHMEAVREGRYVRLSGAAMNPSIRTVDGIEKVTAKLREFGLLE
ncbi:ABC transporter substrate-binding protein [Actinopolyspora mortivallis]|uniref:ABC transporter substrate-binding protein n=1 Tax=Actinopolyspora mortivallis TaxID=33906 RepID=A0A2T0H0N4_ACTMO|nr:ABC transporter substrate-binding protein [Actinopolyspora mortivallis]PRW64932.1 ABC transporter substrate-binding protein [Actinopolyspora mortivallis]